MLIQNFGSIHTNLESFNFLLLTKTEKVTEHGKSSQLLLPSIVRISMVSIISTFVYKKVIST